MRLYYNHVLSLTVPEAPLNLVLTVRSFSSLNVTWDPPNDFFGVSGPYFISYRGNRGGTMVSDHNLCYYFILVLRSLL